MRTLILEKLQKQKSLQDPTILFSDFDGTLYSANANLWKAPIYNRRTSRLTRKFHIPFIVITGRPDWLRRDELEVKGFGIRHTDAVIFGSGTQIYYRNIHGKLIADNEWERELYTQSFTWVDDTGKKHVKTWDKKTILQTLGQSTLINYFSLVCDHDSDLVIRYTIKNLPMNIITKTLIELKTLFPSGIKFELAEKLFFANTLQAFSGDLLIIPESAGKEKAVSHILTTYAEIINKPIHGLCFGDSSVDIGMLSLPEKTEKFTTASYGVNVTPLAFEHLQLISQKPNHYHLHVSRDDGPQTIFRVLHAVTKGQKHSFTKAQNNAARKLLQPFETVANTLIYPNLTADELSFKGLELVSHSIDMLYDENLPYLQKLQLLQRYLLGMSLDVVDGMRSRKQLLKNPHGQLVDVFCDRAKEFYQLYKRAKKRLEIDEEKGYQTILAAMSCILPSLARSQAESKGIIVKELDEKGGSMLSRTKKLFQALWLDIHGKPTRSYAIDHAMYKANMATYHNRIKALQTNKPSEDESFQEKAAQRVILLSHMATQESELLKELLFPYPHLQRRFEVEFGHLLGELKPKSAAFLRDFDLPVYLSSNK